MRLKTKVKVGNISNLSDARYCAGMGVDMLGFKIGEGSGHINPLKFKEITDWIVGPEIIQEFQDGATLQDLEKSESSLLEISSTSLPNLGEWNLKQNLVIRLDLSDWTLHRQELIAHINLTKYVLVTNNKNIAHEEVKNLVAEIGQHVPILLGIELNANALHDYLSWPIAGFALNGNEESSPGIKDYDHLSSILEKLEVED